MADLTYVVPTRPRHPFVLGEIVEVMDREGKVLGRQKITCVRKTCVSTGCGRVWRNDGWWKAARNEYWPFPWIRHSRRNKCTTGGRDE
jgi:hypothetical protein